ncbi:M20/M25/M40 family metallo-hydrolase [Streptomyces sp. NPDC002550]
MTLFNTLIYIAGRTTSATNLALIAAASAVGIALFARLGGERPSRNRVLGMLLALVGVVALVAKGSLAVLLHLDFAVGDLWMVAAMLTFAGYSALLKRKPKEIPAVVFLAATVLFGLVMLAPAQAVSLTVQGGFTPTSGSLSALAYIGVASSALAFFVWNKAVEMIGATRAGVIYYLQPVCVAVLASLSIGETATPAQFACMGLVIAGVALSWPSADPPRPFARPSRRTSNPTLEKTLSTLYSFPQINSRRLLKDINRLAQIGAGADGAIYRIAGNDADMAARDWIDKTMRVTGLHSYYDSVGNVFSRRLNTSGPWLLIGSHSDTVPAAGHLDGAYGVIAAMEVLRTLHEHDHPMADHVETVAWFDEEGVMEGSKGGLTGSTALTRDPHADDLFAYVELHVEQGPRMEGPGSTWHRSPASSACAATPSPPPVRPTTPVPPPSSFGRTPAGWRPVPRPS